MISSELMPMKIKLQNIVHYLPSNPVQWLCRHILGFITNMPDIPLPEASVGRKKLSTSTGMVNTHNLL